MNDELHVPELQFGFWERHFASQRIKKIRLLCGLAGITIGRNAERLFERISVDAEIVSFRYDGMHFEPSPHVTVGWQGHAFPAVEAVWIEGYLEAETALGRLSILEALRTAIHAATQGFDMTLVFRMVPVRLGEQRHVLCLIPNRIGKATLSTFVWQEGSSFGSDIVLIGKWTAQIEQMFKKK